MLVLLKYLFYFLLYGVVWFFIFSIPVNNNDSLFLVLQKTVKSSSEKEQNEKTKNEIHKDQVIDALSKAFKP